MKRIKFGLIISSLSILLGIGCHLHTAVAAPDSTDTVTCTSLKATLSDDKNFYIFRATAVGENTSITGYNFDFGDRQSYLFTYKPGTDQDRHTATVTHTYQNNGAYTPTVHVVVATAKNGQKTKKITSEACKTSMNIDSAPMVPVATLPSVGSTPPLALVSGTVVVSTVAHYTFRWYRMRSRSS